MAREKSEFLSALGKLFEIFKASVDEVKNQGGSDVDIGQILTNQELRKKLVEVLRHFRVIIRLERH